MYVLMLLEGGYCHVAVSPPPIGTLYLAASRVGLFRRAARAASARRYRRWGAHDRFWTVAFCHVIEFHAFIPNASTRPRSTTDSLYLCTLNKSQNVNVNVNVLLNDWTHAPPPSVAWYTYITVQ